MLLLARSLAGRRGARSVRALCSAAAADPRQCAPPLFPCSLVTHEPHFCLLREVVSFTGGGRGQPAREVLDNPCQEHFVLLQIGWVGGRAGRLRRVVVPGGSCSQRDGAAVGGDGDADPAAVSGFSGCCSPYAHPFVLSCAACCATTSHCCSPCSLFPILFRAACCATTLTQSSSRRWRAACPLPTTWSESWTISCCFACWWVWQACDLTRMAMFCMLVGVASLRSDARGYVLHAGGCGKPAT